MTLKLTVTDGGRETVSLAWSRELTDPGIPSSYVVHRCIPPAPMERIAAVTSGRKFIDPNCRPSTTYNYRVAAIGLLAPEDDLITVTTRPPTEFPDSAAFFHGYLSKLFARDPFEHDLRWCPQWQQHMEARVVVNELWRSYEAHRPPDDASVPTTERAVWLTVYAYPLMERLWAANGGLKDCMQDPNSPHHADPEFPPLAG
jgi:hypothetical protein